LDYGCWGDGVFTLRSIDGSRAEAEIDMASLDPKRYGDDDHRICRALRTKKLLSTSYILHHPTKSAPRGPPRTSPA